jgi:uncharacterized protein involved in exopolysaccharide biosynthesis
MNFNEFEDFMFSQGISTLAEIARALDTTPQAVSNWKARNQVPHHIIIKLNQLKNQSSEINSFKNISIAEDFPSQISNLSDNKYNISLIDVFITLAEQIKIIILITFISTFLTFTYIQFIKQPLYVSWATILLPDNQSSNMGGISGLASQFGVNIPSQSIGEDLSSPTFFPELLKSRVFAEKILDIEFYTKEYGKELPLIYILTYGDDSKSYRREELILKAINELKVIVSFDQEPLSTFSTISVTAPEPIFAKKLADVIVKELENLNRAYKTQAVAEKSIFIDNRISNVENELKISESNLMDFTRKNRQISSPSLQLELDRLSREVDVQKEIYLTLKQQLELAKIEQIQKASIVQILDSPQIPLSPSNINVILSTIFSGFIGLTLALGLAFIRAYLKNSNIEERKKIRRVRNYFNKKIRDIAVDKRISGLVSILLLWGLPFYLGHQSKAPVYFGMYSSKMMLINLMYVIFLILNLSFFIRAFRK